MGIASTKGKEILEAAKGRARAAIGAKEKDGMLGDLIQAGARVDAMPVGARMAKAASTPAAVVKAVPMTVGAKAKDPVKERTLGVPPGKVYHPSIA